MKMTIYSSIIVLLALTAFAATAGMAMENITGSVTVRPEFYFGDEDNAKFNEYRYNKDTTAGGVACLKLLYAPEDTSQRLTLDLKYESPEDVRLDMESMSYGMYKFFAGYQRMGHVFAYDVKSLYSGNTTDRLRLRPGFPIVTADITSTPVADALESSLASAGRIDLQLVRDRLSTGLEWMSLKPLDIKASFGYEHRSGSRPFGGNFGFSSTGGAVEIPEPINYDTYNARLDAEYVGDWLYANLGYIHSTFNNTYQSVTFDNPYNDTAAAVASPAVGRFSLPPSNCFNEVHLTLAKSLPLSSRLTTNFSYGWMRQDENLLPATTNPALAPFDSTSSLPRQSAQAKVDRFLADAVFSTRPVEKLNVKLKGRYYMHDNETPEAIFQNIRSDVADEGTHDTEYVSWISRELGAEAAYEVFRRTTVGFEYGYESESYRKGSARKESTNTYKLTGNTFALDWMNARLILEYMNRESAYPDYTAEHAELPWMRKFYAADLDRYSASAMTGFTPLDNVSLCVEYIFSMDNYDDSVFGLQDGWHHTATFDVDYSPMDAVSIHAFYTYENHETKQRSRDWQDAGTGDPYVSEPGVSSDSNWDLDLTEQVHSVGLGGEVAIIPDRLRLKLDGVFALVDGKAEFESPVGGVNPDRNNYPPVDFGDMDDTTWWKASAGLEYVLTKKLSLGAGYRFESWDIDDYTYDGLTEVKRDDTSNDFDGILGMNSLYRNYDVHTVYLTASYTFD